MNLLPFFSVSLELRVPKLRALYWVGLTSASRVGERKSWDLLAAGLLLQPRIPSAFTVANMKSTYVQLSPITSRYL